MRIAITGGHGRVGRAVVELALAHGHSVVSIDRVAAPLDEATSDIMYLQAELTDYAAFEQALRGCDALVHLAAIPSPAHQADYVVHNNNVVASYNALSAAAKLGIRRVCQASSVNAVGGIYSRWPRFDYFPLDEQHPSYTEDPYSLSKWICEQQAAAVARRYESMTITSLRIHGVSPARPVAQRADVGGMLAKNLWGYTRLDATARACLLALTANFTGHEVLYIVAPDTVVDVASYELAAQFFPDVPLRAQFNGNQGFFNCEKAERVLGWQHNA